MTKLLVIRHGYSVGNHLKLLTAQEDLPLTELGQAQVILLNNYILKHYKVDVIYSSDLIRAVDTIKHMSQTLSIPIQKYKELREVNGGDWQGKQFDDIIKKDSERFFAWKNHTDLNPAPNGESFMDVGNRMYDFLKSIAKDNSEKTVAISTHGGAIKALKGILLNKPFEQWGELGYMPNASFMEVDYDDNFTIIKPCVDDHLGEIKTKMPKIL